MKWRPRSCRSALILVIGGHSAGDDRNYAILARRVQLRHVFVAAHHAGADSGHRRFRIRNLRHSQTLVEWIRFKAIIWASCRGITEFLPVSSSGHLQIAKALMGVEIEQNLALRRDIARRYGTQYDRRAVERRWQAPVAGALLAAVQRGAGLRAETPAVDDSDRDRRLHAQRPARRPFGVAGDPARGGVYAAGDGGAARFRLLRQAPAEGAASPTATPS